ncbi:MAG TPA: adenosylcobinamide-phosphate synthase CbiB [Methyloceanibacter sp.]|nr:adenosylcobinamide-phosphate synthase CbiB [Methyloceanibacter sp.]
MSAVLTLLALLFEAAFGYPDWLAQRIGHPVAWIGRLIEILDLRLNRESDDPARRRAAGVLALFIIIAITDTAAFLIARGLLFLPFGLVLVAVPASTLLAQRSLYAHVERVAAALEDEELEAARSAISHIVGRDTAVLDEAGVARAAIESLAENFSDAVVAPSFWMLIAGLPGAAIYKAINTADSMIGHRTERHQDFGWAAARLDDLVNLPASRLTALLLIGAAYFTESASPLHALEAVKRDASRHRSPNAGYPEAAMAGALGTAIAGPRAYEGVVLDDAWMGNGRSAVTASDIRAALSLYRRADTILIAIVALVAILIALA